MHYSSTRSTLGPRMRRLLAVTLMAAAIGVLAALPTAPASASSPSITALPPVDVETLLSETPLTALNTQQLSSVLSSLPGFGTVDAATLEEALDKTIQELSGKGDTLGELLEPSAVVPTLTNSLKEALGPLAPLLETLLGGNPATKLTEALGGTGGNELIAKLLDASTEPQALIAQILAALSPEKLEALLGSSLSGEAFSKSTLAQLASELETTSQSLDEGLGQTLQELPETAMALTAPLSNGTELSILDGVKGLVLGLLGQPNGGTEGAGGNGGNGAGGGNGGSGGSGAGGGTNPASTTLIVENPIPQTQSSTAGAASVTPGKLKVLGHHVKGRTITILVQVPSAGKLAIGGKGVRSIRHETAKAERVTLKAILTKAAVSSLRKHHHLKVALKVSFKQTGGPSSAVTVPVAIG
jgi:hypothetical protein